MVAWPCRWAALAHVSSSDGWALMERREERGGDATGREGVQGMTASFEGVNGGGTPPCQLLYAPGTGSHRALLAEGRITSEEL